MGFDEHLEPFTIVAKPQSSSSSTKLTFSELLPPLRAPCLRACGTVAAKHGGCAWPLEQMVDRSHLSNNPFAAMEAIIKETKKIMIALPGASGKCEGGSGRAEDGDGGEGRSGKQGALLRVRVYTMSGHSTAKSPISVVAHSVEA